jgi:two-component system response regulator HydG
MPSILVVEDDRTTRETLAEFFASLGYVARTAATATEGRQAAAAHAPDVVLVDVRLPDANGLTLFEALRADDPQVAVIFLTGHADVPTAVGAMRAGAADFLEKPVDLTALDAAVRRAAEHARLAREVAVLRARDTEALWEDHAPASGLRAVAPPSFERLVELAARNDDAPVLVTGETGTGKGYVVRRIHELSARRDAPCVEINCASLSPQFVESELFGHEKGAFTDAKQAKRGLLEVAGRGSVFLDEIAELAPEVQPKLLKAIEERAFRRLGGTATLTSQARVLVATHQPLAAAVRARASAPTCSTGCRCSPSRCPPLRERRDEIPRSPRASCPRGARLSDAALRAIWLRLAGQHPRAQERALARHHPRRRREIGPQHLALPCAPGTPAADAEPARRAGDAGGGRAPRHPRRARAHRRQQGAGRHPARHRPLDAHGEAPRSSALRAERIAGTASSRRPTALVRGRSLWASATFPCPP